MKRLIPVLITSIVGTVLVFSVFFPMAETWGEDFSLFFDIIAVFAFFLGGGNLVRVHLIKVLNKKGDWKFSIVTLIAFAITLTAGLFKFGSVDIAASVTAEGTWMQTIFNNIIAPLSSTMYALLAFFVASASYRAFRAKNREATILLIAAFIILLGRTPLGMFMTGWIPEWFSIAQIPNLAVWIMNGPNLAGQRAILIGVGLGVVAMSLRLILGMDRTYLGSDHD
ncbi:MAG: hypothetical protein KAR42_02410 [candidate division Zixibacteria bacterium]|nr:hypothetical protein [candidate division Zixibacteria bacterium]